MLVKLLALAASIFVLSFIAVFSPLFEIKNVTFNQEQKCVENPQDIFKNQLVGSSLIFFNAQSFTQDIKEQFNCIETINVTKQFPSTVVLDIKSQDPIAKIAESQLHTTQSGLLIKASDNIQLPTLFLPQNLDLNASRQITDKKTLTALEIIKNLLKSDFVPATVRLLEGEEIAVYSTKDILVVFSSEKEPKVQVDSLQLILAESKIDATKIDKIDLRFEKPVISYKQ